MRRPAPGALIVTFAAVSSIFIPSAAAAAADTPSNRIVVKLRAGIAARGARPGAPILVGGLPARSVFHRGDAAEGASAARRADQGLHDFHVVTVPPGRTPAEVLETLSRDPSVALAQIDHVREAHAVPTDPFWSTRGAWGQPYDDLWALKTLDLPRVWDVSRGQDVLVAVLDSGVDRGHGDIAANSYVKSSEDGVGYDYDGNGYPGDRYGWDFVGDDNEPHDDYGHGTHIAGIIAAEADNGIGIVGVAPRATILPIKVLDHQGRGFSSHLAAGIVYAIDHGAKVIVAASGCAGPCAADPVVELAVRRATSAGALVVLSAGNRGQDVALRSPQNMTDPKPLVVGALDHLGRRESFSNFGDLLDLSAPGGGTNVAPPAAEPVLNVLSLRSSGCAPIVCPPHLSIATDPNNPPDYLRRAGTSMSAAYVAGVAALILGAEPGLALDALRLRLFAAMSDVGPAGHDAMFGWGRPAGGRLLEGAAPFVLARVFVPAPGQTVDGVVRVLGTAAARTFTAYELTVGAGAAPAVWETTGLAAGTSATAQGLLATWDTDQVDDGLWTLRLVVNDAAGLRREVRRTVRVDNSRAKRELRVEVASVRDGLGSVHLSPAGAFCFGAAGSRETCSYVYDRGATVTLTAVADPLSVFEGWSGACSGAAACTVSVVRLREVRATFRGPNVLTIWFRSSQRSLGGSFVISPPFRGCSDNPCLLRYRPGTRVTMVGEPGPLTGFTFMAGEMPCSYAARECTVVMDRDLAVGAVFAGAAWPDDPPDAYAGFNRTVELGTTVILCGHAWAGSIAFWQWYGPGVNAGPYDDCIPVEPGLGSHTYFFRVVAQDEQEITADVTITVVPASSF